VLIKTVPGLEPIVLLFAKVVPFPFHDAQALSFGRLTDTPKVMKPLQLRRKIFFQKSFLHEMVYLSSSSFQFCTFNNVLMTVTVLRVWVS
jgi:hypothetical protein